MYLVETIGRRLWRIRDERGKSLRVVAELAGMSATMLWRIEHGLRGLESRAEVTALANALQTPVSELTRLAAPAPVNGDKDMAVSAVRYALRDVARKHPQGTVLPVDELRRRVQLLLVADTECNFSGIGAELPGLIRDLHTSISHGRDVAKLLDLAVVLHVRGSGKYLGNMRASEDLRSLAFLLARQAAESLDDPTLLGLAAWGNVGVMLAEGDFDLARAELDMVTIPTDNLTSMQMAGMSALVQSLVAASDKRTADAEAALELAADLADHTGDGNAFMLGFGPSNVKLWRMAATLEIGDHERTIALAEELQPHVHPYPDRRAYCWMDYGRALARKRGRQEDAVEAFRRAESLSPLLLLRNPFAREVIAELLPRTRRDSPAGQELRRMAKRAGLLSS